MCGVLGGAAEEENDLFGFGGEFATAEGCFDVACAGGLDVLGKFGGAGSVDCGGLDDGVLRCEVGV